MTASLSDSRINIYSHKELFSKASVTAARDLPASVDNRPLHQHFVFPQHSVDNGKNLNVLRLYGPGYMEDILIQKSNMLFKRQSNHNGEKLRNRKLYL